MKRSDWTMLTVYIVGVLIFGATLTVGAQDLTTQLSSFLVGLRSGYVKTPPVLVAALPACAAAVQGASAYVTDGSSVTWGATQTGGGANPTGVVCNGTNWTVVSK